MRPYGGLHLVLNAPGLCARELGSAAEYLAVLRA